MTTIKLKNFNAVALDINGMSELQHVFKNIASKGDAV